MTAYRSDINNSDLVDRIKREVTIMRAAERYGIRVNKSGFALCPFHAEKTPSMKLYPKTDSFYCFGCGASGDVINLVQRLFNINFRQAILRIGSDFGIYEDSSAQDRRLSEKLRAEREAAKREVEEELRRREYLEKCREYRQMAYDIAALAPKSPDEPPDQRFVYALHHIAELRAWLDAPENQIERRCV